MAANLPMMWRLLAFVLAVCLQCCLSADLSFTREHRSNVTRSLMKSTWPSDHGDIARSKFTLDAGFPRDFFDTTTRSPHEVQYSERFFHSKDVSSVKTSIGLRVMSNTNASRSQWLYSYGNQSEYIFAINGETFSAYLSKIDSKTLEIVQQIKLPQSLYLGGLLMHANSHAYLIHGNHLYRFWEGNLYNSTVKKMPTSLNYGMVQTNGMLVTSDGYIVIKQWSFNLDDTFYFKLASVPSTFKLFAAIFVAWLVVCLTFTNRAFLFKSKPLRVSNLLRGLLSSVLLTGASIVLIFTAVMMKLYGYHNPLVYWTNSLIFANGAGGGEIKVVDPITLEPVFNLQLQERASFPRMAMVPVINANSGEAEDALILLGDENVYQVRWNYQRKLMYVIPEWTRRYRRKWDGSFPGTGPSIFNNSVYFTDNTFTGFLFGHTFKLFTLNLQSSQINESIDACLSSKLYSTITTLASGSQSFQSVDGVHLSPKGKPGFFFFSTVISPIQNNVIVWDTPSRSIQARHMSNLSLSWEVNAWNIDCISVAADKNQIYLTDYSNGFSEANVWMREVSQGENSDAHFKDLTKFFIVLNATNGDVIANISIATHEQMWPALIIPGRNNDVFLGSRGALVRIIAEK